LLFSSPPLKVKIGAPVYKRLLIYLLFSPPRVKVRIGAPVYKRLLIYLLFSPPPSLLIPGNGAEIGKAILWSHLNMEVIKQNI
jgi:hypothetical protein